MKPKRSRSGPVSRPARVVAPTSVNGGISSGMRGRARALADDHVDAEVLHRHVEHLLGRSRHPVDLVDEQHVALVEAGEDRGEVARVGDGGPAGEAQGTFISWAMIMAERGLAEAGRAREQHVIGRP